MRIAIVYHSGMGHTKAIAESVLAGVLSVPGVEAELINTEDLGDASGGALGPEWDALHNADALIFGSPTYMGTVSAGFKRFMDNSGHVWFTQRWRDKVAAGFTVAGSLSGDKLNTLVTMSVFASQHSMVWVSQGVPSGEGGVNRMGSYLGLMAQADDAPADQTPPEPDHETARRFGERVARATGRWLAGRSEAD